jgi:hypothetical protein
MNHLLVAVIIVVVIVALAEELLAWVWLLVISLSRMSLSMGVVSDVADADDPASIITSTTRTIRTISLFMVSLKCTLALCLAASAPRRLPRR